MGSGAFFSRGLLNQSGATKLANKPAGGGGDAGFWGGGHKQEPWGSESSQPVRKSYNTHEDRTYRAHILKTQHTHHHDSCL